MISLCGLSNSYDFLGTLYSRFCHPIGLMVIGTSKRVLESIVLSETVELMGTELGGLD